MYRSDRLQETGRQTDNRREKQQLAERTNFAEKWQHVIEHVLEISLWAASSWWLEFTVQLPQMHQSEWIVSWRSTATSTTAIIQTTHWPATNPWHWPWPCLAAGSRLAHQLPHDIHLVYSIHTASIIAQCLQMTTCNILGTEYHQCNESHTAHIL